MAKQETKRVPVATAAEMAEAVKSDYVPSYDPLDRELTDLSVYTAAHMSLREKLVISLQEHLDRIAGTPLDSETEMRTFATNLMSMLDSLGNLRLQVTRGKHAGDDGRLMVIHSGVTKQLCFSIRTSTGQAALFAQGMSIPRLRITSSQTVGKNP